MYGDTIKVANKIIIPQNLNDIFVKMNDKLQYYLKVFDQEAKENARLDYQYQNWTYKELDSSLTFDMNFYDNTRITLKNYNDFNVIFNSRIAETKEIFVTLSLDYDVKHEGHQAEHYHQSISLGIYENKIDCECSLNSSDNKLGDVYQFIKEILTNAPSRYNYTINKRKSIINNICFGYGLIPAIIAVTLLCFIEPIRYFFKNTYVLYFAICIGLGYLLGKILVGRKVNELYKSIIPEYDSPIFVQNSINGEDNDNMTGFNEILIGMNADNLIKRRMIRSMERKYKTFILPEILIILAISVAIIIL